MDINTTISDMRADILPEVYQSMQLAAKRHLDRFESEYRTKRLSNTSWYVSSEDYGLQNLKIRINGTGKVIASVT